MTGFSAVFFLALAAALPAAQMCSPQETELLAQKISQFSYNLNNYASYGKLQYDPMWYKESAEQLLATYHGLHAQQAALNSQIDRCYPTLTSGLTESLLQMLLTYVTEVTAIRRVGKAIERAPAMPTARMYPSDLPAPKGYGQGVAVDPPSNGTYRPTPAEAKLDAGFGDFTNSADAPASTAAATGSPPPSSDSSASNNDDGNPDDGTPDGGDTAKPKKEGIIGHTLDTTRGLLNGSLHFIGRIFHHNAVQKDSPLALSVSKVQQVYNLTGK